MFKLSLLNDLQPSIKLGLKQNMYIVHGPQWFEEKTKSEYTIWSIASGRVCINFDGSEYTLFPGDAVIFRPGMHYTAHSGGLGCEFPYQQFSLEIGNSINLLSEINLPGIFRKEHIGGKCSEFCCQIKSMGKFGIDNSLDFYADFLKYITDIVKCADEGKYEPFFQNNCTSKHLALWQAMSYISEHFTENPSIRDIASNTGFSEKYFIRRFTQILGITPKQYLIQCRMKYAAYALLHTNRQLQDIASYLGYADIYSFSKAFKKHFGEPPSIFRENYLY